MELEHEIAKSKWSQLEEEGDVWMKDTAAQSAGSKDRQPWKKKQYAGKLVKSELRDNNFFKDEAYYTKKGFEKVETDKNPYWVDPKDGKEWYLDDEIERTSYFLTIEVLDGDKKGDWAFLWSPHRFGYKKDGTVFGIRGKIALAIDENWNLLTGGIEDDNSDLLEKPFFFTAEPKADKQYCKVTDFLPMDADERKLYEFVGTGGEVGSPPDEELGEEIPF